MTALADGSNWDAYVRPATVALWVDDHNSENSTTVYLSPDEARALAATLLEYADEVERMRVK